METPDISPECDILGHLPIKAPDLLDISVRSTSISSLLSNTNMIDSNIKLQDVVHLDKIDDETGITFVGDRIAQEKKLLRKIDMRMMPMMMLICTCLSYDRCC